MWTTDFWNEFDRSFWALDALRRRMDNLFGGVDRGGWLSPGSVPARLAARQSWPATNVYDADSELLIQAALPGFSEKDVQISVTRDGMTIAGERKPEAPEGYSVHRQERGTLRFSRSFSFPSPVDPEKVSASVKDGLLTVRLAKAVEAQPKQIEIKAAG